MQFKPHLDLFILLNAKEWVENTFQKLTWVHESAGPEFNPYCPCWGSMGHSYIWDSFTLGPRSAIMVSGFIVVGLLISFSSSSSSSFSPPSFFGGALLPKEKEIKPTYGPA